jgi:hypothetical protein
VIDDGHAVHYTAVERGTPIYSSDEVEVGSVEQIVDNYKEHIFDGIVMRIAADDFRFVDAPEVKRTAERAVTLAITAAEVEELPPPEDGGFKEFEPRRRAGKIATKLGFGWKKRR